MIKVEFLGPIEKESIQVDAKSLKELKEILNNDDSLKEWLKICAVAVNDKIVDSADYQLTNGDKISILPPVCGG